MVGGRWDFATIEDGTTYRAGVFWSSLVPDILHSAHVGKKCKGSDVKMTIVDEEIRGGGRRA